MSFANQLTRGLRANPLPPTPDLIVTVVDIFLYRDQEPRPCDDFDCINEKVAPHGPWHRATFPTPGPKTFFSVYVDQCSLQGDNPLWFHMLAVGLDLNCCGITLFRKTGGGGRGSSAANTEACPACPEQSRGEPCRGDDAATLRSLFDALRSFPRGWASRTHIFAEKDAAGGNHAEIAPRS